jgi:hypothetical protein
VKVEIRRTDNPDGTVGAALLVDQKVAVEVDGCGDLWSALTALNALAEANYDTARAGYVVTRGAYEAEGRRQAEATVVKVVSAAQKKVEN